ncbi:MAG: PKD domain-containing protein [Myxococcota bacterium]
MKNATTPIVVALGLLVTGAVASDAYAWRHIVNNTGNSGTVWAPDALPIVVNTADDGAPNSVAACEESGGLSGCCEETVPAGYCYESTRLGYEAWLDAPCADVQFDVIDTVANPDQASPNLASFALGDFFNHVTYNDPGDEMNAGVLAAQNRQLDPGASIIVGGRPYDVQVSGDVSFNDNVVYRTFEEVENNQCQGSEHSIVAVAAHEFGHNFGMAHSCENPALPEGGPCTEQRLFEATMYWTGPSCSNEQATINDDDIEGITALYGPSASFSCSNEVSAGLSVGVAPFTINCAVTSDFLNEVTGADWRWGDGSVDDGLTVSHEYVEPGNYTVEVTVTGDREACGEDGWSNTFRRIGYVRACGEPEASFEIEQVDGLRYQLLNDSDVSVFGCISEIQWDVFKGDSVNGERVGEPIAAWEPELNLPEPGTYTVAMSLGGIGGVGGATLTFEASRTGGTQRGFGCSTGTAPAGLAALGGLVVIGLLARRRR